LGLTACGDCDLYIGDAKDGMTLGGVSEGTISAGLGPLSGIVEGGGIESRATTFGAGVGVTLESPDELEGAENMFSVGAADVCRGAGRGLVFARGLKTVLPFSEVYTVNPRNLDMTMLGALTNTSRHGECRVLESL
jgi:hypothetical protein